MIKFLTIRNSVLFFITLGAVIMTFSALRTYNEPGTESTFGLISEDVDLTLKNISYTKTRSGQARWTLRASSAHHSMDEDITLVKNVSMVFFDKEMGDIEVRADLGEFTPGYQTVTFSSDVTLRRPPGDILETEHLEYRETSNSLQTDNMVKITTGGFIVTGTGMQIDVEQRTLDILSQVKARSSETGSGSKLND